MKEYCYGNLAQANQPQANQPQANQPQAMPFFLRLDKISFIRITLWTRDGFFKKLTDSSCMGILKRHFSRIAILCHKNKMKGFLQEDPINLFIQ